MVGKQLKDSDHAALAMAPISNASVDSGSNRLAAGHTNVYPTWAGSDWG
jgi:hypothetical protein